MHSNIKKELSSYTRANFVQFKKDIILFFFNKHCIFYSLLSSNLSTMYEFKSIYIIVLDFG